MNPEKKASQVPKKILSSTNFDAENSALITDINYILKSILKKIVMHPNLCPVTYCILYNNYNTIKYYIMLIIKY